MAIDCSNANSLFELGFGANAVIALLSDRVRNARRYFLSQYLSALTKERPALDRQKIDRDDVHALLLGGMPRFAFLFRLGDALQLVAALMVAISVGTLLQAAHWGGTCKLDPTVLNIYCGFAFGLLPVLYYAYPRCMDYLAEAAIQRTVPKAARFVAALVANRELSDRMARNMAEAAEVAAIMSEAARLGEPTDEHAKRLKKLDHEIRGLTVQLERSFAEVHREFQREVRSAG